MRGGWSIFFSEVRGMRGDWSTPEKSSRSRGESLGKRLGRGLCEGGGQRWAGERAQKGDEVGFLVFVELEGP